MGDLVTVQQQMATKAAADLATQQQQLQQQQWAPHQPQQFPGGYQAPQFRYDQPHLQARLAAAARQQAPFVHRLTAPQAAAATRPTVAGTPIPAAAAAAAVDPATRATNPYAFFAPGVRPPVPIFPQHQHQQFYGQVDTGFGYVPTQNFGWSQFPGASPAKGGNWQQQQGNAGQQAIRFAALPILVQPMEVETAISWITSCWPVLPADRAQGTFLFAQTGEFLTVRASREGEEWIRLNQREDDQRWALLNLTMAVLSASKTTQDRMMLKQFEALVQQMQFLEHLRKTMPMTEAQLDMITVMHEALFRRLNALEMLYKGVQRAVDEFNASGLVGLVKRKANALAKAKRNNFSGGGGGSRGGSGGGGGSSPRRRARRSGGGGGASSSFGNPAPTATHTPGQAFNTPRQQQQQGTKCGKCSRFGHRTEDCFSKG
jgi:uncharacterized membrane protein YgcG